MLRSLSDCKKSRLKALDGVLGTVKDFLFDDEQWVVRYLVVDTGGWLKDRKVLVHPRLLGQPELDFSSPDVPVRLTRKQVENCPPIDEDAPVSRRYEAELARYYSYPVYWPAGIGLAGPEMPPPSPEAAEEHRRILKSIEDCHVRSAQEVRGYHVSASDGEIGHVEDFLSETHQWAIRYLVIDTRNWLPGRKVLVSPAWIHEVDWHGQKVHATMTRDAIKGSPPYDGYSGVDRKYEGQLLDYYGLPRYW